MSVTLPRAQWGIGIHAPANAAAHPTRCADCIWEAAKYVQADSQVEEEEEVCGCGKTGEEQATHLAKSIQSFRVQEGPCADEAPEKHLLVS